ncbi:MAG TPA: hypothetical protein VF245_00940 [Solirubrobacterales bacterium]
MSSVLEGQVRPPFDPEAKFTARRGPRFELVREEIDLANKIAEAVTERTSLEAPEEERQAALEELLDEDPEIAAIWQRLEELIAGNDESIILAMEKLDREKREDGDEED